MSDGKAAGSHNLRQCFIVLECNFSANHLIPLKNVDVKEVIDQQVLITCQADIWPMILPKNYCVIVINIELNWSLYEIKKKKSIVRQERGYCIFAN